MRVLFPVRFGGSPPSWSRQNIIPKETLGELLRLSTWKRHPKPFAKGRRGLQRRAERRFVDANKRVFA